MQPPNRVCAVSDTGSVAAFRSVCGVKLLNCYQKAHNGPQYHVIPPKLCAHRDILFLRGRCDQLKCEPNNYAEKPACATDGESISKFKSACHIEILNCYQRMYGKPRKFLHDLNAIADAWLFSFLPYFKTLDFKQIASKNCGKMKQMLDGHPTDEIPTTATVEK